MDHLHNHSSLLLEFENIQYLARKNVLYTRYCIEKQEVDQVKERTFPKILQNARKQRGVSQRELAEMTGFTVRVISYWETGRHEISLKNADKVLKALGTTMVIGGEAEENAKEAE